MSSFNPNRLMAELQNADAAPFGGITTGTPPHTPNRLSSRERKARNAAMKGGKKVPAKKKGR